MNSSGRLIIDSVYRSELGRAPVASERDYWETFLEERGAAVFADAIRTSAEAERRRQARTPDGRRASRLAVDRHLTALARELDGEPATIIVSPRALGRLPSELRDRLADSKVLAAGDEEIASDILLATHREWLEACAPGSCALLLLETRSDTPECAGGLSFRTHRSDAAREEAARLRDSCGPDWQAGEVIRLGGAHAAAAGAIWAIPLKARRPRGLGEYSLARRTLAQLAFHHVVLDQPSAALVALDAWDRVMGTCLARRYKAFAVGIA